ncbi:MAG: ABC transporter ATP-binding protein [Clostridia bacterium]
MVALELEGLTKRWPGITVQVDLQVEPGSLVALAGPSGCGKSTVLRMIAGLCPPDSGRVIIGQDDVSALSPRDREVGMVFQDYALFPHLDVVSNVAYGLTIRGIPRKTRETLARDILESVGMLSFAKRWPHELSGGEQQRVALARTIATRPRVVLFDEPLSSLDSSLRKHLRTEIRSQQKRFGLTAIYVTHDLEEAMAMADKVAVMDNGAILQFSTAKELWNKPASAIVARFLGSGPCLPILHVEASGEKLVAMTSTGRFPLQSSTTGSLRFRESRGQSPVAAKNIMVTGTDLAVLSSTEYAATPELLSEIPSTIPEVCIFFERSQAQPIPPGLSGQLDVQDNDGYFSAKCIGTDFAGDTVDCLMSAEQTSFPLRLPLELAPEPGDHVRFRVKSEKIRIIPAG